MKLAHHIVQPSKHVLGWPKHSFSFSMLSYRVYFKSLLPYLEGKMSHRNRIHKTKEIFPASLPLSLGNPTPEQLLKMLCKLLPHATLTRSLRSPSLASQNLVSSLCSWSGFFCSYHVRVFTRLLPFSKSQSLKWGWATPKWRSWPCRQAAARFPGRAHWAREKDSLPFSVVQALPRNGPH